MLTRARLVFALAVLSIPALSSAQVLTSARPADAAAQQPAAQRTADRIEETAKRFRAGVHGGVGLDPEIIDIGAHVMIGPVFRPAISFRPGVELGAGELTTLFAINLDVLYSFPDRTGDTAWIPYLGAGPSFGLSHRGFSTEDGDNVTVTGGAIPTDDRSRFDFSDTDFNGGMNFIAGMRKSSGMFVEMRATAWGVSNIRLVAGFNF